MDLDIKNHGALAALTRGVATKAEFDDLIALVNMSEAFYRLGIGTEHKELIQRSLQTLRDVGRRWLINGRATLHASEMNTLNELMELHSAQLEVITVKDMEDAVALVNKEHRTGKSTPIRIPEDS